ncbi:response regulator [Dyadobacter flavalbus]|uniref:Response regulator n=1 Tax=Dyadobacter flavalbus TaxID=2579942 RepID=A0A5M8QWS7_9BACT|nr:response regulator [Dyadobacter flavalbus]KAA6438462.1 response regulator [Dyadobacter flavalbus]
MTNKTILYVGGDEDDRHLVTSALADVGCTNEVINFDNGEALIAYLNNIKNRPFLILCDFHLHGMTGMELKEEINADAKLKKYSIPFIFLSESVNSKDVEEAYMSLVQGFYVKAPSYEGLKDQLGSICGYWERAVLPGQKV